MPAFNSPISALYPGDTFQVINAVDATAGNVTNTVPVAIARVTNEGRTITIFNNSNQTANINLCDTYNGTFLFSGYTVAPASSFVFNLSGPFVNLSFGSAPTSGTVTIVG